jgi:hypothetical protein
MRQEGTMESLGMCSSGGLCLLLCTNWRYYDTLRQLRLLCVIDWNWDIGM